ncbi:MAG: type II toxin-antitoxin system HicB family antitoxin [Thermoproteota archaeon]|nr:MAG: type II toxin-antitoxin system HicB family antitoxin [Candidatus Korarchaeota archaeon]
MKLTCLVWAEEGMYVAWCPELDIASQGETIDKAVENLREAIELYLEDEDAEVPKSTTLVGVLEVKVREA